MNTNTVCVVAFCLALGVTGFLGAFRVDAAPPPTSLERRLRARLHNWTVGANGLKARRKSQFAAWEGIRVGCGSEWLAKADNYQVGDVVVCKDLSGYVVLDSAKLATLQTTVQTLYQGVEQDWAEYVSNLINAVDVPAVNAVANPW